MFRGYGIVIPTRHNQEDYKGAKIAVLQHCLVDFAFSEVKKHYRPHLSDDSQINLNTVGVSP